MSVNFASESGFCNCGSELLTFFELSDSECSSCAVAAENEADPEGWYNAYTENMIEAGYVAI